MSMTPEQTKLNQQMLAAAVPALLAAVAELPVGVQLDALFNAYMTLVTKSGQRLQAAELLVSVGGQILVEQMLQQRSARTSVPVGGAAEYHDAPSTVQ